MTQTFYNTPISHWSDKILPPTSSFQTLSKWEKSRVHIYLAARIENATVKPLFYKAVFGELNVHDIQELSKINIGRYPALFLLAERTNWIGLEHLQLCDGELPYNKESGEDLAQRAAHLGNIEVLKAILHQNPKAITESGKLAETIFYALREEHEHVVLFLINALAFNQHTTDESLQIMEPKELFEAIKLFLQLANNNLVNRYGFDPFCKLFEKNGVVERRILQPLLDAIRGGLFLNSLTSASMSEYLTSLELATLFTARHQIVGLNEKLGNINETLKDLCEQSADKTDAILALIKLELQNRGEHITRLEGFLLEIKQFYPLFGSCIIFPRLESIKSFLLQTIVPRLLHPLQNDLCKNDLNQLRRYRLIDIMDKLFICICMQRAGENFSPLDDELKKFILHVIEHTTQNSHQLSVGELREFEYSCLKEKLLNFFGPEVGSQFEALYRKLTSTLETKARQSIQM